MTDNAGTVLRAVGAMRSAQGLVEPIARECVRIRGGFITIDDMFRYVVVHHACRDSEAKIEVKFETIHGELDQVTFPQRYLDIPPEEWKREEEANREEAKRRMRERQEARTETRERAQYERLRERFEPANG